jgi:hypothetical protein
LPLDLLLAKLQSFDENTSSCILNECKSAGMPLDAIGNFLILRATIEAFYPIGEVTKTNLHYVLSEAGLPPGERTKQVPDSERDNFLYHLARLIAVPSDLDSCWVKKDKKNTRKQQRKRNQDQLQFTQIQQDAAINAAILAGAANALVPQNSEVVTFGQQRDGLQVTFALLYTPYKATWPELKLMGHWQITDLVTHSLLAHVQLSMYETVAALKFLTELQDTVLLGRLDDGTYGLSSSNFLKDSGLIYRPLNRALQQLLLVMGFPIWKPTSALSSWITLNEQTSVALLWAVVKLLAIRPRAEFDLAVDGAATGWLNSFDAFKVRLANYFSHKHSDVKKGKCEFRAVCFKKKGIYSVGFLATKASNSKRENGFLLGSFVDSMLSIPQQIIDENSEARASLVRFFTTDNSDIPEVSAAPRFVRDPALNTGPRVEEIFPQPRPIVRFFFMSLANIRSVPNYRLPIYLRSWLLENQPQPQPQLHLHPALLLRGTPLPIPRWWLPSCHHWGQPPLGALLPLPITSCHLTHSH